MTRCERMCATRFTYIYNGYNYAILQKIYLIAKRALRETPVPQGALLLFFGRRLI